MPIALGALAMGEEPLRCKSSLARVMATYNRRRSSSISADVPVPRSEGRQPSTTLSTNTDFHSWPRRATLADLASKVIDSLKVEAPDNEKASRKRRLIKGPEEFREDHVDLLGVSARA